MATELEMQATLFVLLVAVIIGGVAGLWYFNLFDKPLYFLLLMLAVLIILYTQSSQYLLILKEYERAVVFRWGAFKTIAGPGWVVLPPLVDSAMIVDLRVQMLEIPPQDVVTRDNIKLAVDALIYMHVVDPKKAIIEVEDYKQASVSFIQANLRDVIGKLVLEQTISNIDQINISLNKNLSKIAFEWGIEVNKVEIQSIELPPTVMDAMHKRRAATEEKAAQIQRAEAQKLTITALEEAGSKLTNPTLHYLYLQSLQKIAEGKSTKFIFPLELSHLAEGLASKIKVPYSQAQDEVVSKYRELAKEGERPGSIIEELKRELSQEKPKKKEDSFE
jgi:regulator of protease activity HflC (stomatin/prohibitin superfamily)